MIRIVVDLPDSPDVIPNIGSVVHGALVLGARIRSIESIYINNSGQNPAIGDVVTQGAIEPAPATPSNGRAKAAR
jgi:hypothetical protein